MIPKNDAMFERKDGSPIIRILATPLFLPDKKGVLGPHLEFKGQFVLPNPLRRWSLSRTYGFLFRPFCAMSSY